MNETAERWLAFAKEDLRVAEVVLGEEIYKRCFPWLITTALPPQKLPSFYDGLPALPPRRSL
jgi:hypothetical protein